MRQHRLNKVDQYLINSTLSEADMQYVAQCQKTVSTSGVETAWKTVKAPFLKPAIRNRREGDANDAHGNDKKYLTPLSTRHVEKQSTSSKKTCTWEACGEGHQIYSKRVPDMILTSHTEKVERI